MYPLAPRRMSKKSYVLTLLLLIFASCTIAGIFSSKQGRTFQTKGVALIYRSGTLSDGIEKRNIEIPSLVDVEKSADFRGLAHDSESGWTKCRVPLKSEFSITGTVERSLVFDCKPLTYYK